MNKGDPISDKVKAELLDSFDEELELELDDERVGESGAIEPGSVERKHYFKELFRLQRELVKLQDWVVHEKLKVVVVFEGRDAAGKGGVIKRITQRLNPRVCRVAALPPPTSASARSGTSSATWPTFRPPARSCCSTAAGTIAPVSSA
jgi:polyphosphate kinase 2 (PPK2 family)